MVNHSQVDLLVLLGFNRVNYLKYFYFCVTFAGYLVIIVLNVSILVLICCTKSLHEPMYIFLANLLCNSLYGCAAFYPKLLHDLVSNPRVICRAGCIIQAFCVHTYVSVECNILTIMAYDRYAAISHPLTYHTIFNTSTVYVLLIVAWLLPFVVNACLLSLSGMLPLCGYHIPRVFCDNRSITSLSCVDIKLISLLEFIFAGLVVFLPLLVIVGCYVKILVVTFSVSKATRSKSLSTCVPHLVTYISFVMSIVFELVQPALITHKIPHELRVIMSLEGFLILPVLNPIIYGMKLPEIRNKINRMFIRKTQLVIPL